MPPVIRSSNKRDLLILLLLGLGLAGSIIFFGGARNWAAGLPLVCFFFGMFLLALRPGREIGLRIPGRPFLVLFLVYLGLSGLFHSPVFYSSKQEGLYALSYAGAGWAWAHLTDEGNRWRAALVLFVFGVSLIALYALGLHLQGLPHVLMLERPEQYGMRASGTHICPNHFAHLLTMAIIVSVSLLSLPRAGIPTRLMMGYALAVMVPAFVLTQSRSGWLGLTAGLLVTFLLRSAHHSRRRFILTATGLPVAGLGLAAGLAWLSPVFRARWLRALEGDVRLRLWPDVWAMIRDNPVWGHGPGTFAFTFPPFRQHFDDSGHSLFFAHNEYLHAWSDYGLAGLALLVAAAVTFMLHLFRIYRTDSSPTGVGLAAGLLGVLSASMVHALFDFNFHLFGNVHALALILGAGWAGLQRRRDRSSREAPASVYLKRAPALAVSLAGLLASIQFTASAILQAQGTLHLKRFDQEAALTRYRMASRVDPSWALPYQSMGHIHQSLAFWRRDEAAQKQQRTRAEACYLKALENNPLDAVSRHGLARLYRQDGRAGEALPHLQEAMRLNIFNLMYKTEYGLLLKALGQDNEATRVFEEILLIDPGNAVARANLP